MRDWYRRSDILFSAHPVSISLTQPDSTFIKWQVFRDHFSCQLSTIAHICTRFSAFLSCAEDLRVSATQPSSHRDDSDCEEWLKLIHAFRGAKWFHVAVDSDFSTNSVREPDSCSAPLLGAVVSFVHSRRLYGHLMGVDAFILKAAPTLTSTFPQPAISCTSVTSPCSFQNATHTTPQVKPLPDQSVLYLSSIHFPCKMHAIGRLVRAEQTGTPSAWPFDKIIMTSLFIHCC